MPLDNRALVVLDYWEQFWHLHSELPTKEHALETGLSEEEYDSYWKDADFKHQLVERGIRLPDTAGDNETFAGLNLRSRALTSEQLTAVNLFFTNYDTRSFKKKLGDANISWAKWTAWTADPVFQQYLRDRSERTLENSQHEANEALVARVRDGDINAIKYYNEMTGRFKPGEQAVVDARALIMGVIDIISRRVHDPIMAKNISNDLLNLGRTQNIIDTPTPVGNMAIEGVVIYDHT